MAVGCEPIHCLEQSLRTAADTKRLVRQTWLEPIMSKHVVAVANDSTPQLAPLPGQQHETTRGRSVRNTKYDFEINVWLQDLGDYSPYEILCKRLLRFEPVAVLQGICIYYIQNNSSNSRDCKHIKRAIPEDSLQSQF